MLLAAVTLWYFLVSDQAATGEPAKLGGYKNQVMCERMASFVERTRFNAIVHVLEYRPNVIGHLKNGAPVVVGGWGRRCFSERTEPGQSVIVIQR